ncbi:MAG: molybdopterin-dependent oxidoreductase [Caldilineaceae bacterium]|nr:molybdopterin-dependent oxidoreductase [Caldilineaceae bacterium]
MTPHHHHDPSPAPAWVHGHAHEPNPLPPSPEPTFVVHLPNGVAQPWTVAELQQLAAMTVTDCYIVSTGHGTSGPFTFTGVSFPAFLAQVLGGATAWHTVDVISADGFGTRFTVADLAAGTANRPALLAYQLDGQPLTRAQGLVRLIVPTETDDALRQVKWVAQIRVYTTAPA